MNKLILAFILTSCSVWAADDLLSRQPGTPVTPGVWKQVTPGGVVSGGGVTIPQTNGYDNLSYCPAADRSGGMMELHEITTEQNRVLWLYSWTMNRWDIGLHAGGYNDDHWTSAQHLVQSLSVDPTTGMFIYALGGGSSSNSSESAELSTYFDCVGLYGKAVDQTTSATPPVQTRAFAYGQLRSTQFDPSRVDTVGGVTSHGIMFGTGVATNTTGTTTSEFDPVANTFRAYDSGGPPNNTYDGCLVYNSLDQSMYQMMGDLGGSPGPVTSAIYKYHGGSGWTTLTPTADPIYGSPAARAFVSCAFNPTRNHILFAGGCDISAGSACQSTHYFPETWFLDLSQNYPNGQWVKLPSAGTPTVVARDFTQRMTYHVEDNAYIALILPPTGQAQTWIFCEDRCNNTGYMPVNLPTPTNSLNFSNGSWARESSIDSNGSTLITSWIEQGKMVSATSSEGCPGVGCSHVSVKQYNGSNWAFLPGSYAPAALIPTWMATSSLLAGNSNCILGGVSFVPTCAFNGYAVTGAYQPLMLSAAYNSGNSTWSEVPLDSASDNVAHASPVGTLQTNISPTDTTFTVSGLTNTDAGKTIYIGTEHMLACIITTGGVVTLCPNGRGFNGTVAASHSIGDSAASHFRSHSAEVAQVNVNGVITAAFCEDSQLNDDGGSVSSSPFDHYCYVKQQDPNTTKWSAPIGGVHVNHFASTSSPTVFSRAKGFSITPTTGNNFCVVWTEYQDNQNTRYDTNPGVYVSCWNAVTSTWVSQNNGNNITAVATDNAGFTTSVAYLGGQICVAFTEHPLAFGISKVYVRCSVLNSAAWTTLGGGTRNRDIANGWSTSPQLKSDGTNLWLVWDEQGNILPGIAATTKGANSQPGRIYVDKWNGSTWSKASGALNVDTIFGSATSPKLTIAGSNPTVLFEEVKLGSVSQIYVKQLNPTTNEFALVTNNALGFVGGALASSTVGMSYSQSLLPLVSGGTAPYTFTTTAQSGAYPTGTTLSSGGTLSGTLTTAQTATFTVKVTDNVGAFVTSASITVKVNAAMAITTSSPLVEATNGVIYNQTIAMTGGTAPYTWSTTGSVPPGLTVDPSTGILSGTAALSGQRYSFTALVTDAAGASASKSFSINVDPVFSYGSAVGTPTGCTHTNAVYATLDLNTCTTSSEVPFNSFTIPSVGSTYTDANFGTPVKVLSRNDTQGASHISSSGPSAFSASGTFAVIAVNDVTTVINASTGAVQATTTNGTILGTNTVEWDATDEHVYYYCSGAQLNKYNWSTNTLTVLIDFATAIDQRTSSAFGFTSCSNGGRGDVSKDNWWAGLSDDAHHQVLLVNLANSHVYARDYQETHNGRVPASLTASSGYVLASKGADSISGKRYAVAVTSPLVHLSVTGDTNNGVLNFELLGPEVPANIDATQPHVGNDNNTCEVVTTVVDTCYGVQRYSTMEDTDGQQYLVSPVEENPPSVSDYNTVSYFRLNAGSLMARSVANESGGRTDTPVMESFAVGGDSLLDSYIQCAAKAPICALSIAPPARLISDTTSAYTHTAHMGTVNVLRGVGLELRQLVYGRSVVWHDVTLGDECFPRLFASLSSDGSKAIWNTNLGYNTADTHENVVTAATGFSAVCTAPAITNGNPSTATAGVAYSFTFTASGTTPTWSATGLPAWATINAATGVISGASPVVGTSSIVVTATNGCGSANQSYSLVVVASGNLPSVTTTTLPGATQGTAYNVGGGAGQVSVAATGGVAPYVFAVSSGTLPTGLGLTASGANAGAITGTPTGTGTSTFGVTATDANSQVSNVRTLNIVVAATMSINSISLPSGSTGASYTPQTFTATGGTTSLSWSLNAGGSLPPGLSLSGVGVITGIPTTVGTYPFTVKVTDAQGATATQSQSITITAGGGVPVVINVQIALDTHAIIQYTAPTYSACSALVSTHSDYTSPLETLNDSGGIKLRSVVFGQSTPLPASTLVYSQVTCGGSSGTKSFTTAAAITPASRTVNLSIPTPPYPFPQVVDALIEYGTAANALSSSVPVDSSVNWATQISVNTGQMLFWRYCYRSASSGACPSNPNIIGNLSDVSFLAVLH